MPNVINGTSTGSGGLISSGDDSGILNIQTNETTAITVDASQNVGLSVTPNAWGSLVKPLQIGSAGAQISAAVTGYSGSNWLWAGNNSYLNSSYDHIYARTSAASLYQQNSGVHSWWNAPSGTAGNVITFTQAMTLDASGNLLVGSTTQSGGFVVVKEPVYSGWYTRTNHPTGVPSGYGYADFLYNGSAIGSITQSGTTAVLFNTTSDQRLKENIQDSESASTLIDALKVRQFNWKTDNSHQRYGFVAQELVTVAPEAVHQPVNTEDMMAVDYSKLVPMLVKEIQSLRQRITALEGA